MTSADVAAAAGVSRATVSYVLNGVHERISEETRARVIEAADRLGYVPNAMASALRAGRTEVVLLALPSWPFGPPVADFVTTGVAALERVGYTPLVHFRAGGDSGTLARACDRVRPVGLIAPGEDVPPERVRSLHANGTRAVIAIAPAPLDHVATHTIDQALVGEVALDHLIERGHKHVVAVVPGEPEFAQLGEERLGGARAAAADAGIKLAAVIAAEEQIGAALEQVMRGYPRPTALYAFNDEHALAAIAALKGLALDVPGDIAVIGCDDSPAARRAGLTTILLADQKQDWSDIVARLQATIEGEDDRTPLFARPRVVPGSTT